MAKLGRVLRLYHAGLDSLILLPDPSFPNSFPDYPSGTRVLGLYPDTTSFYRATILEGPRRFPAGGGARVSDRLVLFHRFMPSNNKLGRRLSIPIICLLHSALLALTFSPLLRPLHKRKQTSLTRSDLMTIPHQVASYLRFW